MTHTNANLTVSAEAFDEIQAKLAEAGYRPGLNAIDMHGLTLVRAEPTMTDEKACELFLGSGFKYGWEPGDATIGLDGEFSALELEAITHVMVNHLDPKQAHI